MAANNGRHSPTSAQPPIVAELQAVFRELPDADLLASLQGAPRRGPKGYAPKTLWRCYVASFYLGLPSVSDLVRLLHDNPYVAEACGVEGAIPSQPTFSRFVARLAKMDGRKALRAMSWGFADKMQRTLHDFGKSVAIDSTDIKAWSNGGKRGKVYDWEPGRVRRQFPKEHKVSDPDAGWCVKTNTDGNKKYVWGYKVHILTDTKYELPIVIDVTAGNVHDSTRATAVLRQAKEAMTTFMPKYFIADAAYSSDAIRKHVRRHYWKYGHCESIIDPNPSHIKASARTKKTPEWKAIYNRRTAAERVNSRLKGHRRLNDVRTRGRFKVYVHAMLSVITMQAQALATGCLASVRKVAA